MALDPIAKGVVVTISTEQFTTKQRSEKSHFRFSSAMTNSEAVATRIAPAASIPIVLTATAKYLCVRAVTGTLDITITKLDGSTVVMPAAPILILTGLSATGLVITNTDLAGSPPKDVVVELYY